LSVLIVLLCVDLNVCVDIML